MEIFSFRGTVLVQWLETLFFMALQSEESHLGISVQEKTGMN